MAIRLLNKASLCYIFGEYTRGSNKPYYSKLRQFYFTDEVLQELNISEDRYNEVNGGHSFTFSESIRIIQYFKISLDELSIIDPGSTSKEPARQKGYP